MLSSTRRSPTSHVNSAFRKRRFTSRRNASARSAHPRFASCACSAKNAKF
jgi:hypothetical protein